MTTAKPRYIISDASANMPNSCWGVYRRIAILELEPNWPEGKFPAMISKRAKGVKRVVRTWERLNVGKTNRCAYNRAYAEAKAELTKLNR